MADGRARLPSISQYGSFTSWRALAKRVGFLSSHRNVGCHTFCPSSPCESERNREPVFNDAVEDPLYFERRTAVVSSFERLLLVRITSDTQSSNPSTNGGPPFAGKVTRMLAKALSQTLERIG